MTEIIETYSRVAHCQGRNPPGDVSTYGIADRNPSPQERANGIIQPCQNPPLNTQCPTGYIYVNQCKDDPKCRAKVGSTATCPQGARQQRAVCRRDWDHDMTPERIQQCCDGTLTGALECRSEFCPNSEACHTFLSGACNRVEFVETPACQKFCDAAPELCKFAIEAKCQPGERLDQPFCKKFCKKADCTPAYK